MNKRIFTSAILISLFPLLANAGGITLNEGDFLAAQKITRGGEVVVSLKLSKSGKAKFKKLNKTAVNEQVHAEIGGVETNFKLRVPIAGDQLEMGPYAPADADKVIAEINK
jgi:hypothetical protein